MHSEAFRRQFEMLSAEYRRGLPMKFAELERLWRFFLEGRSSTPGMTELRRELHTLAGTAKTMGVPAVTDAARVAEEFLASRTEGNEAMSIADQEKFQSLLDALKYSLQTK